MIIRNISDLARYYETPISELSDKVNKYSDYKTAVTFDDISVTITTTANEYDISDSVTMFFPFRDVDFEDIHSGLQCWADETWCNEYYHKGE